MERRRGMAMTSCSYARCGLLLKCGIREFGRAKFLRYRYWWRLWAIVAVSQLLVGLALPATIAKLFGAYRVGVRVLKSKYSGTFIALEHVHIILELAEYSFSHSGLSNKISHGMVVIVSETRLFCYMFIALGFVERRALVESANT